jgi:iron(III) transport system permease protein
LSRPLGRAAPLTLLACAFAVLLSMPVLGVVGNVFSRGHGAWAHLVDTVLAAYIANTAALAVGVGVGVFCLGVGAAWLVAACDFPGRRLFEWALVLPLAAPAYVLAYAYTDLLQFSGPVQTALRAAFGWQAHEYWFPRVRSLPGAILMLTFAFYPYVYLLARVAFLEQSRAAMEAARTLGLGPWAAFFRVALPLARPALAGGVALALMETLAEFGAVSYFGLDVFTTGVYRAWISMGDRVAAAQLSTALLGFVAIVLLAERLSRRGARHHHAVRSPRPAQRAPLGFGGGALAILGCLVPIVFGFLAPAGALLRLALGESSPFNARFVELACNSLILAALAAVVAAALALLLRYAARLDPRPLAQLPARVAALGYAMPGTVVAVGALIPLAAFDNALSAVMEAHFGWRTGLLLSGGIAALIYAYLVRFLAVSLQAVEAGFARIRPSLDDAARSLGASPLSAALRVHAPLLSRSVLTGGFIVFVEVMKELPATLIMRPFNFDTLAVQVYNLASDERLAEAAGPALALVAVGLAPVILLTRTLLRSQE